jgi:hypothetical protein
MSELGHCWHSHHPSVVPAIYPPFEYRICCWCGKVEQTRPKHQQPEGHGKYIEPILVYAFDDTDEPCPERGEG